MSTASRTRALADISHATANNEHNYICGICNKSFSRRDLRDRHKRRCAKASSRLPTTKRKSCLSCVRSKVRCDTGNPVCSRCREKGKECQYVLAPLNAESKLQGDPISGASVAVGGFVGTAELMPMGEIPERHVDVDAAVVLQQILDGELPENATPLIGRGGEDALPPENTRQENDSTWNIPNDALEVNFNEEWLQDIDLSGPLTQTPEPFPQLTPIPKPPETWHLSPDFTSLPHQTTTPSPILPLNTFLATARLSTLSLTSILLDIPTAMVRTNRYAPFVHHNLYDCSSGENVPTPIANAFCALKAYEAAVGASIEFVHSMLNSERERLVESFQSTGEMKVVQVLAVVHAMCMYQIIGFFDGDVGQVIAAKEKNGAFLEMGRRLVRMVSGGEVGWGDWAEWRVWETVVRTVHVVHAINVISTRHSGGVYEPLDREAVLDLPLPCKGDVWRATTGVEWARARRKRGDMEVLTMRKLIGDEMALKHFISGLDGDNDQKKFQDCDDLMKLVLASVEI